MIETEVYFWALYSFPLVYVSVLMPVPGCFNDSDLVMQFDIRYCDSSYFALLSQSCCNYSGSFMVPYKFLKCLYYICEVCHWYFNRNCIESINRFGQYGHFDDDNSSNSRAWYMLPFVCVFLNFFLQCCVVFLVQVFYLLGQVDSQVLYFSCCYIKWDFFPDFCFCSFVVGVQECL